MAAAFIALLRAVNVGGTGRLPMKDLAAACREAGLGCVSTYIASGNLVFLGDGSASEVETLIAGLLRDRFGLTRNHTIIRRPGDLAGVIAGNPFPDAAIARPHLLMVNFLVGEAWPGSANALADFVGPERLWLAGRHLYVDYPQGVARSKLTPAILERLLRVPSTARNWNTANRLLEMARTLEASTKGLGSAPDPPRPSPAAV